MICSYIVISRSLVQEIMSMGLLIFVYFTLCYRFNTINGNCASRGLVKVQTSSSSGVCTCWCVYRPVHQPDFNHPSNKRGQWVLSILHYHEDKPLGGRVVVNVILRQTTVLHEGSPCFNVLVWILVTSIE